MARVDELLTLPGADLEALLAALEQDLRRRQFRGMRFVLNGLREEDRPLWQALHARGFASRPDPTMVSARHGSRPAREILRDCAVSGLWAPPYWAPA
jgi:hypothetical protein